MVIFYGVLWTTLNGVQDMEIGLELCMLILKRLKRTPKRSSAFFKELSKNNWIP